MAETNYIFEDFQIDSARRLLIRRSDGEPITLTHKAFQVLLLLVENGGRLVTKSDLMAEVWSDTFVEEGNLTQTISVLRKTLGENPGEHRFIVTESGKGYRFVAPVTQLNGHVAGNIAHEPSTPEIAAAPRKPYLIALVTILAIAAVIGLFYFLNRTTASQDPSAIGVKSIAVLPFHGIEADDKDNVLGIGMADAVIARLSRIKSVVVRQTGSLLRSSDATPEAVRIGRQINVDAVLEGSIQKAEGRIRVAVRLFRVSDGSLVWAENFDERETDIFVLQDTIAERVARSLSLQLSTDEAKDINRRSTDNLEAYHLYNKGRFFWNRRSNDDLRKSVTLYEQAIAKDPNFALAYAGIAESYVLLQKYSDVYTSDAFPKAKEAAEKALALDPNLAEGHAALGLYKEQYEWNWPDAEEEFKKAIASNPNYATAHQWYGEFLAFRGRIDESIAEIETAFQLDPLSLSTNTARAFPYLADRSYANVLEKLAPAFELESDFPQALYYRARAYEGLGQYDKAIDAYDKAIASSGRSAFFVSAKINSLVKSGERMKAEKIFNESLKNDNNEPISRYVLARSFAALEKKEKALDALDAAVVNRDPLLAVMRIDANFDDIRSEPRFQDVLKKIGF
jgi:TolB-like protein/DNA-binding winged helix-turn-helix (wHTH) protein/Tfp pilus assembly protein PilF